MKIYSIKEIVKATNNFLKPESKTLYKNDNRTKKIKIPVETINLIIEAERSITQKKNYQSKEKPLILNDKTSSINSNKLDSFNYKIKIKPEIKDRMINELYLYLKKKIKKNTLKLIIDEQVEIKNLKNKINFLKSKENKLKNNYQILKSNYESIIKSYEKLKIDKEELSVENKDLKINNEVLQKNLNQANQYKDELNIENKDLKINNEVLQKNLNQANQYKDELNIKNKELDINLKETKLNLDESLGKNRSFEINNAELKNTVSRYITNSKKIQEKINSLENGKNLELANETKKIKFYQDENVRLSSELLSAKKKNETIKENLNTIETEKEKISNKIKELNKSIDQKTNIIPSSFVKETTDKVEKNDVTLSDKEQKSLDEVISRIFAKI